MLKTFSDVYKRVSGYDPVTIAVVNPEKTYLFQALEEAEKKGWIHPVVYKDKDPVIAAKNAVSSVATGKSDLLMKGDIKTAILLKEVMSSKNGIRTERLLSHIAVVKSKNFNRLMLMTDGGVNPVLTDRILDSVIYNAIEIAQALEINKPNIAMLSLVEEVTDKIPESKTARETVLRHIDNNTFNIEGPIALDVALSEKAARSKNIESKISGKTDIFIGPNITTINFMVKALIEIGNANGGGIIIGAKAPIVLLSRSDSIQTKLNSVALGILTHQHSKKNT